MILSLQARTNKNLKGVFPMRRSDLRKVYTGVLVGAGAEAISIWILIISELDSTKSPVKLNPMTLAATFKTTQEKIQKGIKKLLETRLLVHVKGHTYLAPGSKDYGVGYRENRREYMKKYMKARRQKMSL